MIQPRQSWDQNSPNLSPHSRECTRKQMGLQIQRGFWCAAWMSLRAKSHTWGFASNVPIPSALHNQCCNKTKNRKPAQVVRVFVWGIPRRLGLSRGSRTPLCVCHGSVNAWKPNKNRSALHHHSGFHATTLPTCTLPTYEP